MIVASPGRVLQSPSHCILSLYFLICYNIVCFMFSFFGLEVCGIFTPQSETEPAPLRRKAKPQPLEHQRKSLRTPVISVSPWSALWPGWATLFLPQAPVPPGSSFEHSEASSAKIEEERSGDGLAKNKTKVRLKPQERDWPSAAGLGVGTHLALWQRKTCNHVILTPPLSLFLRLGGQSCFSG